MNWKKHLKNSIISLVMIGAILMPYLSFIPSTYAQQYSSGGSYNGGSGYSSASGATGQGLSYYMKLAGPMIPKLQGCGQVLKNGIGAGINAIKTLFSEADVTGNDGTTSDLKAIWGDSDSAVSSISVDSKTADKTTGFIQSATEGAKKIADVTASNKLCLDSVGKMIAKMLIKALTDSTIAWINTGNFGESFWPKDRQHYFEDIAKNEIMKFNSEINNPDIYPFARAFMQNQILTLKNHFAQNAQYSLNQMIKDTTPEYTSATFTANFASGGWNAWNALTQVPANNPIGFNITASSELQNRLIGTTQTAAQDVRDTLKEAGGFLGQEQCASNHNITRETERQALIEGNPHLVPGTSDYNSWENDNICQKWEYVTPGKMIAEASTKLMGNQQDQLLSINDLNDAIAAILDAAINKYGGDLMNQGLASLTPVNPNNQFDTTDPTGNGGRTQVQQDFAGSQGNTAWLQDNPDFNIRTDITQALVDQQRTNVTKLEDYNRELDALNRTIYQLDYCMPGPHPGWDNDARTNLDSIEENIKSEIPPSQTSNVLGTIAGILDPSGISGAAFALENAKKQQEDLSDYIAGTLASLTGEGTSGSSPDFGTLQTKYKLNKDYAISFLEGTFNAYKSTIKKYYGDANFMPFTWSESVEKFNKIPGYKQIIEDNKSEIIFQNENIKKLQTLKEGIDNGTITDFSPTSFVIKQFARISQNLVSGNDIANTNSLYEQTKAERDYVWNDLLKGPNGCEQELHDTWRQSHPWQFSLLRRPNYPFPHLYDYNMPVEGLIPNDAVPSIPGIVFSSVSPSTGLPYANKQAFTNVAQGQSLWPSFLLNTFRVGSGSDTDNFTCAQIGVDCGYGWTNTPITEHGILGSYFY